MHGAQRRRQAGLPGGRAEQPPALNRPGDRVGMLSHRAASFGVSAARSCAVRTRSLILASRSSTRVSATARAASQDRGPPAARCSSSSTSSSEKPNSCARLTNRTTAPR